MYCMDWSHGNTFLSVSWALNDSYGFFAFIPLYGLDLLSFFGNIWQQSVAMATPFSGSRAYI